MVLVHRTGARRYKLQVSLYFVVYRAKARHSVREFSVLAAAGANSVVVCPQDHSYAVSAAIVGQHYMGFAGRKLPAIQFDASDATAHAMRVFDQNLVARGRMPEEDFEARPIRRDARRQKKFSRPHTESQDPLEPCAVHPAGRTRVPRPTAASLVRGFGVNVADRHIRFHFIAMNVRAGAPVAMPLRWNELDASSAPTYHVTDFAQWRKRLSRDPWEAMLKSTQRLVLTMGSTAGAPGPRRKGKAA